MEEYDRGYAIAVHSREGRPLPFGQYDQPDDQSRKHAQDEQAANESPLFTHGAKDEIGALLRYKVQAGLCSLKEALTQETTGADCNFRLVKVIPHSQGITFKTKYGIDSRLHMSLEDFVKDKVDGEDENQRSHPS